MLGNGIGWITEEFSEIEFGDKRLIDKNATVTGL